MPYRLACLALLGLTVAGQGAFAQEITASGTPHDPTRPEFNFLGFGDIGYISRDSSNEDGFVIGQAVAQVSASLDDSLSVFGEFTATGHDDAYSFEVERLIVKYDFSDHYKLSGGRYHTPVGYWNSAFHHGAWLQTTTTRPEMVRFGSKILPVHFVGMLLEGSIPSGNIGLEYKAGFGNGRHSNISRGGDSGDLNGDKAWMVQLNSKLRNMYGLNLGIGYYSDEISMPDSPNIREGTFSAYAAWSKESPEVIFEYIHSDHELVTDSNVSGNVDAWYLQAAYRLAGSYTNWKPYVRFERNDIDESDPLLGAEGLNYEGGILGVRWDFNPYAAIKFEYRNEEFDSGGRENNFRLQLAFVLSNL